MEVSLVHSSHTRTSPLTVTPDYLRPSIPVIGQGTGSRGARNHNDDVAGWGTDTAVVQVTSASWGGDDTVTTGS